MSCTSLSSMYGNAASNLLRRSRPSNHATHHHNPVTAPAVRFTSSTTTTWIRSTKETKSLFKSPSGSIPPQSLPSSRSFTSAAAVNPMMGMLSSSEHSSSTTNDQRIWEILLSTGAALAASAALVKAFPSEHKLPGGGGGPPRYNHSVMYAGAPLQQEEEEVVHKQLQPGVKKNEEKSIFPYAMTHARAYEISARAIKGGRLTMEDEYFVTDGGRFAAVFDGHGGGGVSSFLKHNLYGRLTESLEQMQRNDEDQPNHRVSLACQVAALRSAFNQTENEILRDDSLQYQGSTAVAVVLHDGGDGHRTVLSANVGDSRAILSRYGRAVELTRDHKPNEEREKARILSMGETIEWDRFAKVHRVRNLSLSRAMGDRYAKPFVTAEVEIMRFPVNEHGDEFVLLASDGLWDVMTSQDVVSYVHHQIANEMGRNHHMDKEERERFRRVLRKNMSKYVAREALKRGSSDNICVVMVWLDDVKKPLHG